MKSHSQNPENYKLFTSYLANFNNSKHIEHIYRHYNNWDDKKNVLNGIAFQKKDDTFILMGKMWDHIYNVEIDYHKYVT